VFQSWPQASSGLTRLCRTNSTKRIMRSDAFDQGLAIPTEEELPAPLSAAVGSFFLKKRSCWGVCLSRRNQRTNIWEDPFYRHREFTKKLQRVFRALSKDFLTPAGVPSIAFGATREHKSDREGHRDDCGTGKNPAPIQIETALYGRPKSYVTEGGRG
jgi:hypothetical protein